MRLITHERDKTKTSGRVRLKYIDELSITKHATFYRLRSISGPFREDKAKTCIMLSERE